MLTKLEGWSLILQLLSLIFLALLGLEFTFHSHLITAIFLFWGLSVAISIAVDWREIKHQERPGRWMLVHSYELLVLFFVPPLLSYHIAWIFLLVIRQVITIVRALGRWSKSRQYFRGVLQNPALLMVLSFLLLIALGTLLLSFPMATKQRGLSFLNALFTSTSASCVTGLSVLDISKEFTLVGQLILLFLIQAGGLGMMTLSSFVLWLLGRRLGLRSQHALGAILDEPTPNDLLRLLRTVLVATLVTEIVGALVLFCRWYQLDANLWRGLYLSVFHSISAFCNAGFALWSDSLVRFQADPVVNFTLVILIFAGSLGFPVFASLFALKPRFPKKKKIQKLPLFARLKRYFQALPLNTKVIILAHPLLVFIGFAVFFFLEQGHTLKAFSTSDQLLVSLFQSATLRTAGFNSVDLTQISQATLFFMLVWMFIGGCSAGTAGGIKVNTVMVLFLSLRAKLRGRDEVEAFGRSIHQTTVQRAHIILLASMFLLFAGFFSLLVAYPNIPFSRLLFEATSALGTVGLSLNTTTQMGAFGKVVLVLLMFAGRIGPLTVALAIKHNRKSGQYSFPRERMQVG